MELPIDVLKSWQRVNKKINEFCENDLKNSFKMLFITDVHIGAENRNHIKQLEFVRELTKINKVDLIVNGGDIGLDVGENDNEAKEASATSPKKHSTRH